MQGIFNLGIVGTKDQILNFINKYDDKESCFYYYVAEENNSFRNLQEKSLEDFQGSYKIVITNSGSGNISGIEESIEKIGNNFSELELLLLTQHLDYSDIFSWMVWYKPAGKIEPSERAGQLFKGEITETHDVYQYLEYKEFGAFNLDINYEKFKEYLENKDDWEYIEPFLDILLDPDMLDFDELGEDFDIGWACDVVNAYLLESTQNVSYYVEGDDVPSVEYISELFKGTLNLDI